MESNRRYEQLRWIAVPARQVGIDAPGRIVFAAVTDVLSMLDLDPESLYTALGALLDKAPETFGQAVVLDIDEYYP